MKSQSPGSAGVSPASPTGAGETPALPARLARLLLESVGVAWLAVVAEQYGLKMLRPAAPDLSAAYLPLLASTLIAGIMAYRFCRPEAAGSRELPSDSAAPRETDPSDESIE